MSAPFYSNFIHTVTLLHVSALKGPSSGSSYTFHKSGLQNTCSDVKVRLKSSFFILRGSCHIFCSIPFSSENRAVYETMWKNNYSHTATDAYTARALCMLDN